MGDTTISASQQMSEPVADVMSDRRIAAFIAKNAAVEARARQAAEWLVTEHGDESRDMLVATLDWVLPALRDERLNVFFSYKARDQDIANDIAKKLTAWSAGRLKMEHMANLGVQDVGRDWREKIERSIPQCHWFLLLLPTPGYDRDWVLFEAGYFSRGQGLGGRLVCLHHPDNKVGDALGEQQSVPANVESVRAFLEGLFHRPNWIPGMPPINPDLDQLEVKAREIVNRIKPPATPAVRSCCGPHMEIAFDDASKVQGWEQLARGRVIESNQDCRRLFGLDIDKPSFGDWFGKIDGVRPDDEWVTELAQAVRAAGEGCRVPAIGSGFN